MHPKVLSGDAWRVVRVLRGAALLENWTLAGGTGLALQIGHRYSEDLDFFRAESFAPERLLADLSGLGAVRVLDRSEDTLHVTFDGLRVSVLRAQSPFLYPGSAYRGLTIADARDIAVMKIVAIGGWGSRKDFVDLHFYLRGGGTLDDVFELLRRRFRGVDYNEYHLLKSLAYFDDAESEPMPRMIKRVSWKTVRKSIEAAVKSVS